MTATVIKLPSCLLDEEINQAVEYAKKQYCMQLGLTHAEQHEQLVDFLIEKSWRVNRDLRIQVCVRAANKFGDLSTTNCG